MASFYPLFYKITHDEPGYHFLKAVAYGLSGGYFLGLKLHQWLYKTGWLKQKSAPCHTISVGNLVLGGVGKTPFTMFLARLFKNMGKKVMVVTRGYKGQTNHPLVSNGYKTLLTPLEAGDEAYLLAKNLKGIPIIRGKNRYQAIMSVFKDFLPDIIILDDAFQHYALKRDLDIVLLSAHSPFGKGHLLPRGRFREPISALNRAQAVVITHVKEENQGKKLKKFLKKRFPDLTVFTGDIEVEKMVSIQGKEIELSALSHKCLLAFCGLAEPVYFYQTCKALNLCISHFLNYPDHHRYTKKDVLHLIEIAKKNKIDTLITTEKDMVKLLAFSPLFTEANCSILYPSITMHLYQIEAFISWIKGKLGF
ncbi:MAG: tetraacyldisaccharide 4'-kinase [Candidatus Desulfofervidus auxilii]|nr:tetraacyldisaccharide 4'-kinase [Candidatus Desulfofervidus auxilii]